MRCSRSFRRSMASRMAMFCSQFSALTLSSRTWIADGQRVRALAADRLAQAYGVLDGFEREGDVLRRQFELSGDFLHGRLAPQLGLQAVARGERFIGDIPKRTADANGVVIPKIAPNLADNHRYGVGRKRTFCVTSK